MINLEVHSTYAVIRSQEPLTVGLRGAKAFFAFGEPWEGLVKTAVFRQGQKTVAVTDIGQEVTIPWEVLTLPGVPVMIGIYGVDAAGAIAIPTLWAQTEPVRPGADPEADPSTEPTPGLWEQMQGKLGSMEQLDTEEKSNLVAAINEAKRAIYVVDVTKEADGSYKANKTVQQLMAAHADEKVLVCRALGLWMGLSSVYNHANFEFTAIKDRTKVCIAITEGGKVTCNSMSVVSTDGRLPNPQKLTFIGAAKAEYDGSEEVIVGIPTKVSQLSNDSGYLTQAPVTSVNGQTGDVILSQPVMVTVSKREDGTYEADRTYSELKAAREAGITLLCRYYDEDVYLPFASWHGVFTFCAVVDNVSYQINISTREQVFFQRTELVTDLTGYATQGYVDEAIEGIPEAITPPDTAAVGQTIVVKEVDENGKPILWEAADLPSGGSGSFNDNPLELINEITLEEDVHDVIFNTEADGTPLELEDFYVQVQAKSTTENTLGHTTVNGVFLQNFGFTVSNTTDFSEYTVTYFLNVGQAIIKGKRSGVGQGFSSSSIAAVVVNRPITSIRFHMAAARVDIQSGSNFKLYGRRVKK